ncbi:hypothetical protein Tco_0774434 [Tanacetum coccineum]|uniref:Uncharacterized protein n=1 Tax=Tanacetum coccineum TaxID=301880 RepID=A0ABQ4ZNH1_9ASTR
MVLMFTSLCPHMMYKMGILKVVRSNLLHTECSVLTTPSFANFLWRILALGLLNVTCSGCSCVCTWFEFVLVSAQLELSLSLLVIVSAPLGLDLLSVLDHLESALVHLAIQTIYQI